LLVHQAFLGHFFGEGMRHGLLEENGLLHVSLGGTQPRDWSLLPQAARHGLRLVLQTVCLGKHIHLGCAAAGCRDASNIVMLKIKNISLKADAVAGLYCHPVHLILPSTCIAVNPESFFKDGMALGRPCCTADRCPLCQSHTHTLQHCLFLDRQWVFGWYVCTRGSKSFGCRASQHKSYGSLDTRRSVTRVAVPLRRLACHRSTFHSLAARERSTALSKQMALISSWMGAAMHIRILC
jgi:hypothetical protein